MWGRRESSKPTEDNFFFQQVRCVVYMKQIYFMELEMSESSSVNGPDHFRTAMLFRLK